MVDEAEPDLLRRTEMEARKVPPLSYVLFLYLFLTCPIWISATVAAVAENLSAPMPGSFYVAAYWINSGGMIFSVVVTAIAAKRTVRRKVALGGDAAEMSSFRLGWGTVRVLWKGWWIVVARGAVISSLIFCYFGFCIWLGHRVKKRRSARQVGT